MERSRFRDAITSNTNGQGSIHYQLLVWDAWYAYQNGELTKMRDRLQESLKYTPLSSTETILNWLDSFTNLFLEKGCGLDTPSLTNSAEWKQLMRQVVGVKPQGDRGLLMGQA